MTSPAPTSCRVCLAEDVRRLPIGVYAPFFQARVDTSRDFHRLSSGSRVFLPCDGIAERARMFEKAYRTTLTYAGTWTGREDRTFVQACARCLALTVCHDYSYEALQGLYADYRSASYNRDRIAVEPTYAALAEVVGNNPLERINRNLAADRFLKPHLGSFAGGTALDFGGSDGRFLSRAVLDHFPKVDIFDVSAAPIHPSVPEGKAAKIGDPAEGAYSFLMCMHVVEHVGNPRGFVEQIARYLQKGGLIYIEVPLEMIEERRRQFLLCDPSQPFIIHEHINNYDIASIPKLIESIDSLTLLDAEDGVLDLGWCQSRTGRYLARKD